MPPLPPPPTRPVPPRPVPSRCVPFVSKSSHPAAHHISWSFFVPRLSDSGASPLLILHSFAFGGCPSCCWLLFFEAVPAPLGAWLTALWCSWLLLAAAGFCLFRADPAPLDAWLTALCCSWLVLAAAGFCFLRLPGAARRLADCSLLLLARTCCSCCCCWLLLLAAPLGAWLIALWRT